MALVLWDKWTLKQISSPAMYDCNQVMHPKYHFNVILFARVIGLCLNLGGLLHLEQCPCAFVIEAFSSQTIRDTNFNFDKYLENYRRISIKK